MSLRTGLFLPQLARAARAPVQKRAFHLLPPNGGAGRPVSPFKRVHDTFAVTRAARPQPRAGRSSRSLLFGIGLGLAGLAATTKTARCEAAIPAAGATPQLNPAQRAAAEDPEVKSIVSVGTLTFGAVCGISAGVFVKKGFKLVAFFLGGVFVLLQSRSFVTVDWKKVSKSYDGAFASVDDKGQLVYPTPQGVLNGFIDFLTANFQQRATFIAGFLLGLRVG